MKKWFAVLFFSFVSVAAFAQMDPHFSTSKGNKNSFTSLRETLCDEVNVFDDQKVHNPFDAAVTRKVAQAQAQAKAKTETKSEVTSLAQQAKPSWPHEIFERK